MEYTIQFYTNPYTYPDYGNITAVGSSFDVTGVDINDNVGMLKTDKLTFAQRYSVNYLKITRDAVVLYANITSIDRISGDNLVQINFRVDALRSFKDAITFGNQFVVRHPGATYDLDPMLRGANGELNTITTTKIEMDNPIYRVLVVQLMREDGDTTSYSSPVQPAPYVFYFKQYDMTNPQADADINALMKKITDSSKPTNLASIYSIPVFSSGGGTAITGALPLNIDGSIVNVGTTFFKMTNIDWKAATRKFKAITAPSKDILRTQHSVNIVIPEAGILNIPDDVLFQPGLKLVQDIDIYTGASNYMLIHDNAEATNHSVRGGQLSAIPVAYDVTQQLLAANRWNIGTGFVSDVASMAVGIGGLAITGATGGLGAAAGIAGAGMIAKGAAGLMGRWGSVGDTVNQQVNPPAFLGSALTARYNQTAYMIVTRAREDNGTTVRARYGYPVNQIESVIIPSSGYIQTQDCNVSGNIPMWAKEEINAQLDNGLRVK